MVLGVAVALVRDGDVPPFTKGIRIQDEEVELHAQLCGVFLQQQRLFLQGLALGSFELAVVADPDVEITLPVLAQGARAAHQVEAQDGREALGPAFFLQAAGVAPGGQQCVPVRFVAGNAGWCVGAVEPGQRRVVQVQQQWQQRQKLALLPGQCLMDIGQALPGHLESSLDKTPRLLARGGIQVAGDRLAHKGSFGGQALAGRAQQGAEVVPFLPHANPEAQDRFHAFQRRWQLHVREFRTYLAG